MDKVELCARFIAEMSIFDANMIVYVVSHPTLSLFIV